MNLLEKAIDLAVRSHAGQIDEDGKPHIVHCFEVFRRVQEMLDSDSLQAAHRTRRPFKLGEYTQEEIELAAILHDTVEDSSVTLELIEQEFGSRVREIVDSVTRRGTKTDTKEAYRDFVYRAKANAGGHIVKLADLSHNLSRTPKIKKASWRNKLQFKYSVAMSVLNDTDEPTWEQASASIQYEDNVPHYFVADPNGKKIEVTEEQFKSMDAMKPRWR